MTLEKILSEARTLREATLHHAQESGKHRLKLMFLLLDLERRTVLWSSKYESWEELLRQEKLCAITSFSHFKTAKRLFGSEMVKSIGVSAAVTLAQAHSSIRFDLAKFAREEVKRGVPVPRLSKAICAQAKKLRPAPTRGELVSYIEQLKKRLSDLGIKAPPMS